MPMNFVAHLKELPILKKVRASINISLRWSVHQGGVMRDILRKAIPSNSGKVSSPCSHDQSPRKCIWTRRGWVLAGKSTRQGNEL